MEKYWCQLIEGQPFIRYERTSFGGRMVDRFLRSENIRAKDLFELDEIQSIVQMVGKILGVALAPLSESTLPLPENIRVISLGEHGFKWEIGFVRRRSTSRQSAVSALALLLCQAAEISTGLGWQCVGDGGLR